MLFVFLLATDACRNDIDCQPRHFTYPISLEVGLEKQALAAFYIADGFTHVRKKRKRKEYES